MKALAMIGDSGKYLGVFSDREAWWRQLKLIPEAADILRLGEDAVGVGKQPLGGNLHSVNG